MTDLAEVSEIPKDLHLIRHARPIPSDQNRTRWPLHPSAPTEIRRLSDSIDIPDSASWYSSPELRALATARLLSGKEPTIVNGLHEQERPDGIVDDFEETVKRSFRFASRSAAPGWEPFDSVSERITNALDNFDKSTPVVVVGHGVALSALVAVLTNQPPDFDAWRKMKMPDHAHVHDGHLLKPWGT